MINQKIYNKEYYKNNREKLLSKQKEYRVLKKDLISEKNKSYYLKNKATINKKQKEWYKNNKDSRNKSIINYRLKNKEKLKKYQKKWFQENKVIICEKIKLKYKADDNLRVSRNLRARLYHLLKKQKATKKNKTLKYLGCSFIYFKSHIEKSFKDGMNWENYGKWHIDHIRPISKFDLTKEKNIFKAMNYKNLQPLWARDNIIKSNK